MALAAETQRPERMADGGRRADPGWAEGQMVGEWVEDRIKSHYRAEGTLPSWGWAPLRAFSVPSSTVAERGQVCGMADGPPRGAGRQEAGTGGQTRSRAGAEPSYRGRSRGLVTGSDTGLSHVPWVVAVTCVCLSTPGGAAHSAMSLRRCPGLSSAKADCGRRPRLGCSTVGGSALQGVRLALTLGP